MKNLILTSLTIVSLLFASCSRATYQGYYEQEEYSTSELENYNSQQAYQGYPQQEYSSQEYPQQEYSQQGYPQQEYPSQEYPQQGYPQQEYPQQSPQESNYQTGGQYGNFQPNQNIGYQQGENQINNINNGDKKTITIPDGMTGQPMITMRIPSNWNYSQKGLSGPNNIQAAEVGKEEGHNRLMPIQQKIDETKQVLQNKGIKITKTYPLPSVAMARKRMNGQLWTVQPMNITVDAIGIEGSKDGKPVLFMIVVSNSQNQFYKYSLIEGSIFTADPNAFEQGKNDFIQVHASCQYIPQYIAQYNRKEQQKIGGMQRDGANRLNNMRRNFEAQNSATIGAQNEVNNRSMEGYYGRSLSNERGQENYIHEGVHGGSTLTGSNANNWQVEGQAQQYWMNQNGEYIPSNDPNWNPNTDPNYNGTWQLAPQRNY